MNLILTGDENNLPQELTDAEVNHLRDYRKDGKFGYDAASKSWIKITRIVEYKSFASKHVCDARCYNATGRIMKCECACGGKNHGRGAFNCEEAA